MNFYRTNCSTIVSLYYITIFMVRVVREREKSSFFSSSSFFLLLLLLLLLLHYSFIFNFVLSSCSSQFQHNSLLNIRIPSIHTSSHLFKRDVFQKLAQRRALPPSSWLVEKWRSRNNCKIYIIVFQWWHIFFMGSQVWLWVCAVPLT